MKLTKLSNGMFRLTGDGHSIEGAWPVIQARMQFEYEVDPEEIDRAMQDLRDTGNDVADFGVSGIFIYSYRAGKKRYVVAELKAVSALRQEFNEAYQKEPNGPETKQAFDRLMNLYMSLNVEAVLDLLEGAEEPIAA